MLDWGLKNITVFSIDGNSVADMLLAFSIILVASIAFARLTR